MKVAVKNLEIVLLCFIIESNVCILCTPLSAGGGGCNCHIKNKIWNICWKKKFINKNIFLCHDKELNNNLLKLLKYLHENNEADVNSYWILMWQFGNLFPQQMFIDHFAMVLYGYFQKQPFADVLSKRCS